MNVFHRIFGRETDYRAAIIDNQENWILVRQGSSPTLCRAVEDYGHLVKPRVPQTCTVAISRSASDFFALRFLDRIPTYNFLNLIEWLNQPPDLPAVSGALGWYRSPANGVKYALYPDSTNTWGDTLIGYNQRNQAVSVYLPEASLCEISRHVMIFAEPDLNRSGLEEQARVEVSFDVDSTFGNPDFIVTHAKDHQWT
jgi:hypothetical protein